METNDPIESALLWLNSGHNVAIATVVKTWGSAPRKAGSQLAIRDDGLMVLRNNDGDDVQTITY